MADIDDAYAAFFQAEYRSVLKTALLIVHDPHRAEDVTQDAFVQLYQHWRQVSRYERPAAWVRRVVIRLAVRDVKRARVREALQRKSPAPLDLEPPDVAVVDAVKQLPARQRAAIALFYLEDRPVAEIAGLLGISVSTCTVHLTRGRRGLAALLKPSKPASSLSSTRSPTSAPTLTPLEGTWRSVLRVRDLERRGFNAKQIKLLQAQDAWSFHQVNEIRVVGGAWTLWQGKDGGAPTSTGDFGRISMNDEQIRFDDGASFLLFRYRLRADAIRMTLVRSTCEDDPIEPIPNFMYAAVFGQPYRRQG